jgi:hypothetical protein
MANKEINGNDLIRPPNVALSLATSVTATIIPADKNNLIM